MLNKVMPTFESVDNILKCYHFKLMHQSIPAGTIPPGPGIPRGFVRPCVPGAGILYNNVLPRGLEAWTT